MRKRGGAGPAMAVIEELAKKGVFRERDLTKHDLSHNWLHEARMMGLVTRHRCGVWSHRAYVPTRYELMQVRVPKAVFWGPTALWLLGVEAEEPAELWLAIGNKSRSPRNLDLSTVLVRTRHLEDDVVTLRPGQRLLTLRAYSHSRSVADIARANLQRMLERAASHDSFTWRPRPRPSFP